MTLTQICSMALGIPAAEITEATGPGNDLRWNSLGHLRLVAALEETYGLRFTQQEIRTLASVGAVRALLAGKGVSAS